ncbi:hypothetical protein [Flavihumibacter sp. CACIAM 22H1]|uniref:hypothetical protein n=1 Tax=Flavihumibacter sp. CACIAM 22H1 TaxID=1812911 RepID=UPI0007A8ED7C|nr:hypothetical protein [Flavihumibacter sp. CACIAM 22H1]KYP13259.1 MAG: hypothetical protein A1D16_08710 [Flavihumibacter sp. CACIAM 22H1]
MLTQLLTNKGFKKFLLRLGIFLLVLFVVDFVTGSLLRKLYFKQESGPDYETIYAMEKSREELMVFGSSRARNHYHPQAFEEILDLSFYNAGRNGNFILYSNAVAQAVLKRHRPKIVLLDIVAHEFEYYAPNYEKLSVLLPFYKTHPEIRATVDLRGQFEPVKLCFQMYPFNSTLLSIGLGNTQFYNKKDPVIRGYSPINRELTQQAVIDTNNLHYEIDSVQVKSYLQFIQSCKKAGVDLYVVCSPYFNTFPVRDKSVLLAEEIAKKYHIPFWDHSQDPAFSGDPKNFYDVRHLNEPASLRFSRMIAEKIKSSEGSIAHD